MTWVILQAPIYALVLGAVSLLDIGPFSISSLK
jgi:hypothetical protein